MGARLLRLEIMRRQAFKIKAAQIEIAAIALTGQITPSKWSR